MPKARGKIKKGNVARSKTRNVNHPAARKALRRTNNLIQTETGKKSKQIPSAKTTLSTESLQNKQKQVNKVMKSQQPASIKKKKTSNQKTAPLRKTTPNILNKVNAKTKTRVQQIGKKITKKTEKKIPQPNTDIMEDTLEYAVPLNDYWNSLSFGTKSYDSLFSHQVDTPHIWADPTVWNIVFAAVPTEYAIPDQDFVNVLSQRIAWNLLQSSLPEENVPTLDTMMQALTNPTVPSYSDTTTDPQTFPEFYETDSFELDPYDDALDGVDMAVSPDVPDPADSIGDTRHVIENGIESPSDNLSEQSVKDSTNENSP